MDYIYIAKTLHQYMIGKKTKMLFVQKICQSTDFNEFDKFKENRHILSCKQLEHEEAHQIAYKKYGINSKVGLINKIPVTVPNPNQLKKYLESTSSKKFIAKFFIDVFSAPKKPGPTDKLYVDILSNKFSDMNKDDFDNYIIGWRTNNFLLKN